MYKLLFKYMGLEKLPLAGFRTYILLFVTMVTAVLPQVTEVIAQGGSLTDLEFLIDVGKIVLPLLLAAGFKKVGVEAGKAQGKAEGLVEGEAIGAAKEAATPAA